MPICSKCLIDKNNDEFYLNAKRKQTRCKSCILEYNRKNRHDNLESFKAKRKKYYCENRENILEQKKRYAGSRKAAKSKYDKEYRQLNKDRIKKNKKRWEEEHRDDPIIKIKRNLRRRIHHVLNGRVKSSKTEDLLGCSFVEFKRHLESQFTHGMTWENYGEWHIDHIVPCYTFNLLLEEEQRKCFHYSNQRPLWAKDNLSRPRLDTNI